MITWLYFNVSHPLGMLCRTETWNFSFNPTKYDTIVLKTTYNRGNMIYMSDKSIFQDFWQQQKKLSVNNEVFHIFALTEKNSSIQ